MDIFTFVKKSFCFSIASISTVAFSWWDQPHQMISLIASENITPKAYEKAQNLLNVVVTFPGNKQLSANTSNFDTVGSWADAINQHSGQTTLIAHKLCHYTDLDMDSSLSGTDISYDDAYQALQKTLIKNNVNSLTCLKSAVKTLTLSSSTPTQQAIALRFVIHLVEDMAQPLHNISKIKNQIPDRGGNNTELANPARIPATDGSSSSQKKLHAVWDAALGSILQFPYKPSQSKYGIYSLEDLEMNKVFAQNLQADPNFHDRLITLAQQEQTIEDWVIDGYQIAAKYAYSDLSEAWATYSANRNSVVNMQLIKSSVRLIHLLNSIFDPENSSDKFNSIVNTIHESTEIKPFILK